MRPRLLATLILLVLAPLAAIGWLGVRVARDERESVRRDFDNLLAARLVDLDRAIGRVVAERERELSRIAEAVAEDPAEIRELVAGQRLARQVFVLDEGGRMTHPPPEPQRNRSEREFMERTRGIWEAGERFYRASDREARPNRGSANGDDRGWHTWYQDSGINFIFWKRDDRGRIIGVEVERLAMLSDIVGELPDSDPADASLEGRRLQLVDEEGRPLYVWGSLEPGPGARPRVTRELGPPLGAFRLHYFVSPAAAGGASGRGAVLGILAGLLALGLAVVGMATYLFRESGREAREAEQRVTFVNQVSHELKTPLTNIRMYAELLEDQIDEEEEKARDYLGVIVSESQRLSRLISNVLSFARKQRKKLAVRPAAGRIDEAVTEVVAGFRPGLAEAGLEIEVETEPDGVSRFDRDALGQILGNLLSNVEKYAATGRWVRIASGRRGDSVRITVTDRGPGIPADSREEIFEPFTRLSRSVAEGAAGTGIGLSIARDLARLHGGDLALQPLETGSRFLLDISAPLVDDGGAS